MKILVKANIVSSLIVNMFEIATTAISINDSPDDFFGYEDYIYLESCDDYINVSFYSSINNISRDLFHFHKTKNLKLRELYNVIINSILNEFAEFLI